MATELGQAYVQIIPSAKGISGMIQSQLGSEADAAGESAGNSLGGKLVSTLKGVLAGAAIGKMFHMAMTEGADLEQSLGGIETLFKGSADKVKQYANDAYKTAGLSANGYMENVTSFSASLLQSMGGDTEKAAETANMAMIDMSDNANKMGTNIGDIQNAYQGFAKQNYTMLDNLKLGYGGTKEEMQWLLADAEKLTGVKYDINNLGDVYNAIHAIQEELDITGTTAKEASETLSGSAAAMKGAFANVLGKISLGQDIGPSLKALAETTSTFLVGNFIPMVVNILKALPGAIISFIKESAPYVKEAFIGLFSSFGNENILSGFLANLKFGFSIVNADVNNMVLQVKDRLPELNQSFSNLGEHLAPILTKIGGIISTWAVGISSVLTYLIPLAIDVLRIAFDGLVEFVFPILNTVLQVFWDLSAAIMEAVMQYAVPALQKMIDWVRENESTMKLLTVVLAGALAGFLAFKAIKGLVTVFDSVKMAIAGAKTTLLALKGAILANPLGILLVAAGALAAGLVYLYKSNENFRNSVNNLAGRVKEMITNFTQSETASKALSSGLKLISGIGDKVASIFKNIGNSATNTAGSIDWVSIGFTATKTVVLALLGPFGLLIKAFSLVAKALGGGDVKAGVDQMVNSFKSLSTGIQRQGPIIGSSVGSALQGILTAIGSALPGIIQGALSIISGFVSGIAQGLPQLALSAVQLITAFTSALLMLIPTIAISGAQILTALTGAIVLGITTIATCATQIIVAFITALTVNLPQIITAGMGFINSLLTGITQQLPLLILNGATLIVTWLTALTQHLPSIVVAGMNLLIALLQGIASRIGDLTNSAISVIVNFAAAIASRMGDIINVAVDLIVNFVNAIASRMNDIVGAAANLIASFITGIANNLDQIISSAANLIVQFLKGIADSIPDIVSAGMDVVDGIVRGLIEAQGRLMDAAIELVNGFADNIESRQDDIRQAAWHLLDAMIGVFVPDALWDAGSAMISGFLEGLQDKFEDVKDFVGDIAEWIKDNKGPISYDKKLLIPAGNAIMIGLKNGLQDKFQDVKAIVSGMADQLAGSFRVPVLEGIQGPTDMIADELDALNDKNVQMRMSSEVLNELETYKDSPEALRPVNIYIDGNPEFIRAYVKEQDAVDDSVQMFWRE